MGKHLFGNEEVGNRNGVTGTIRTFTLPPAADGTWGYGEGGYAESTDAYAEEMLGQPIMNLYTFPSGKVKSFSHVEIYPHKYGKKLEDKTIGKITGQIQMNPQMIETLI